MESFTNQLPDTLPELVALPLVVNKAISQVPGHHKLQRSTCLLIIVHRVHLREPETTVEPVLQWNKVYRLLFIITGQERANLPQENIWGEFDSSHIGIHPLP